MFQSTSVASPFGSVYTKSPRGPANPFGGATSSPKPFNEPSGLSPELEADEYDEEPWYTRITFGQVVRDQTGALVAQHHVLHMRLLTVKLCFCVDSSWDSASCSA
jgi:hypothetical protein